jgi:hypothetical protein
MTPLVLANYNLILEHLFRKSPQKDLDKPDRPDKPSQ